MATVNLSLTSDGALLPSGFPRRVIRRLIVGNRLGVGSRVLVAGSQSGDLARFFESLGLRTASCEDAETAAATSSPETTLDGLTGLAAGCSREDAAWDLVLAAGLGAWQGSLFAAQALHTTASLLSCTRSGGVAMLLVQFGEDGCAAGGHTASCFVRHLSHFSGELDISDFPEGFTRVDRFAWIVGRRPRPGCLLAGLRVPAEPPSPFGWHEQAETAIRQERCCRLQNWAAQSAA